MATAPEVPTLPVSEFDRWVISKDPSEEAVAAQAAELLRLEDDARRVRARLVGFVRDKLDLDELDPDPVLFDDHD